MSIDVDEIPDSNISGTGRESYVGVCPVSNESNLRTVRTLDYRKTIYYVYVLNF